MTSFDTLKRGSLCRRKEGVVQKDKRGVIKGGVPRTGSPHHHRVHGLSPTAKEGRSVLAPSLAICPAAAEERGGVAAQLCRGGGRSVQGLQPSVARRPQSRADVFHRSSLLVSEQRPTSYPSPHLLIGSCFRAVVGDRKFARVDRKFVYFR